MVKVWFDGLRRYVEKAAARRISGTRIEPAARRLYAKIYPDYPSNIYDLETLQVLQRILSGIDKPVAVDVGAHEGFILRMMMRYGNGGEYWAFEPIEELAEGLRKKYKRRSVHVWQAALGNSEGAVTFNYCPDAPHFSGLQRRTDVPHPDPRWISRTVPIHRLDGFHLKGVRVIKIDVEGAEHDVIRGAIDTIQRCRPYIILEHGPGGDIYNDGPEEMYRMLSGKCQMGITLMRSWLDNAPDQWFSFTEFIDEYYQGRNFMFLGVPGEDI